MSKKTQPEQGLPPEVVDHWPEVFEDIDIQVIPLEYLHSVIVTFDDGKIWNIDLEKTKEKTSADQLEATLDELFAEYDDYIKNVDFRLDTERLKSDIQARTKHFMKKRK